jgi:hypothetical protein
MFKGSIVLLQSYGTSFAELGETILVQRLTRGPYVHAAVLVDEQGTIIEARNDGVHRGRINNHVNGAPSPLEKGRAICSIWTANRDAQGLVTALDERKVDDAIAWLEKQADAVDPYSWLDVVSQGFEQLFPGVPMLAQPGRYDCSNLCAMFLFLAGVNIPFKPPFEVCPNDLAQYFGLLPNRKEVLR